jgi:ABC-type sugar transport system ATPase subunit
MSKPYIELNNVGKVYDTQDGVVEACADVSLEIRESEFVAVVGPSGCGKTTLMKMVAGLVPYSSGSIEVGGRRVDSPLLRGLRDHLAHVAFAYSTYQHAIPARNCSGDYRGR